MNRPYQQKILLLTYNFLPVKLDQSFFTISLHFLRNIQKINFEKLLKNYSELKQHT